MKFCVNTVMPSLLLHRAFWRFTKCYTANKHPDSNHSQSTYLPAPETTHT